MMKMADLGYILSCLLYLALIFYISASFYLYLCGKKVDTRRLQRLLNSRWQVALVPSIIVLACINYLTPEEQTPLFPLKYTLLGAAIVFIMAMLISFFSYKSKMFQVNKKGQTNT